MAERPTRFEHTRWLGDKRSQVVYDVESAPQDLIDELVAAEAGQTFGPDTLVQPRGQDLGPGVDVIVGDKFAGLVKAPRKLKAETAGTGC